MQLHGGSADTLEVGPFLIGGNIATFPLSHFSEFIFAKSEGEGLRVDRLPWVGQADIHQGIHTTCFFFGCAEFEKQRVTGDFLTLEFFEASPEVLQAALAHSPLLAHPFRAAGQYVQLTILLQQSNVNFVANLLPGLGQEGLFKFTQFPFGGAYQVEDRTGALPHDLQYRFGRNAPIHHPGALSLAVLRLDGSKEIPQGGFVTGVAGQHFIGQRETLRGHNETQNDLHTIGSLVAAVAKLLYPNTAWVGLKIRTGQVIEQNVRSGRETGFSSDL